MCAGDKMEGTEHERLEKDINSSTQVVEKEEMESVLS